MKARTRTTRTNDATSSNAPGRARGNSRAAVSGVLAAEKISGYSSCAPGDFKDSLLRAKHRRAWDKYDGPNSRQHRSAGPRANLLLTRLVHKSLFASSQAISAAKSLYIECLKYHDVPECIDSYIAIATQGHKAERLNFQSHRTERDGVSHTILSRT